MAANRKLQQMVEATLRKVDEGIADFGAVWRKCEDAQNQNQREKNQADLKREIKKLQRYREDIMKWMSNSDIKDKAILIDSRKRIEVEMERFKSFERESKTKPFSYMGLQMEQKVDPNEIRKQEKREQIEQLVLDLKLDLDALQADWEALNVKKKKSKDEQSKMESLKVLTGKHGFHVLNLELLVRKLDNDSLDLDEVDNVVDYITQYVTDHSNEDFFHDETLYQSFRLDELAVDESYYRPALEEKPVAPVATEEDEEKKRKEREARAKEIPLSAAAKAKAFKKDGVSAAGTGAGAHAPAPSTSPPPPARPAPPACTPPPAPVSATPPSRTPPPAPVEKRGAISPPAPKRAAKPTILPRPAEDGALRALAQSAEHKPVIDDTILKTRTFTPHNSVAPISGFPTEALEDRPELFRRFQVETLLLIFYFREGSYSQLLAARELQRQGWRFHRKLRQWIKRHDEPRMTTTEYEIGSVATLDPFEAEWRIRVKPEFTFEYIWAEDDGIAAL